MRNADVERHPPAEQAPSIAELAQRNEKAIGRIISLSRKSLDNRRSQHRALLQETRAQTPQKFERLYDNSWMDLDTFAKIIFGVWQQRSFMTGDEISSLEELRVVKWNPELASTPANFVVCASAEAAEHNRLLKSHNEQAPHSAVTTERIAQRAALWNEPNRWTEPWSPVRVLLLSQSRPFATSSAAAAVRPSRNTTSTYSSESRKRQRSLAVDRGGVEPSKRRLAPNTAPVARATRSNGSDGSSSTSEDDEYESSGDDENGKQPEHGPPKKKAARAATMAARTSRRTSRSSPENAQCQYVSIAAAFDEMGAGVRDVIGRMGVAIDTMVALETEVSAMERAAVNIMKIMQR